MAIVCRIQKHEVVQYSSKHAVGGKTLALWISIVLLMVAFAGFSASLLLTPPAAAATPAAAAPSTIP